ncbi:MAG: purine-binding chemotaxis protein CheW [Phycisphaeraceae bacterium]|nr:purine-binding chemotaxis protein CheW [Phycisphaeraceae bacterium]
MHSGPASRSHRVERAYPGRYLSFHLGCGAYGLDILRVREIIAMIDITPLPGTPDFVRGIINLRGRIIPVVELRRRLGIAAAADDDQACIIVVEREGREGSDPRLTGVIVDRVSEIVDIDADSIGPAPRPARGTGAGFISGVGRVQDTVIPLLAIDRILHAGEVAPSGGGAGDAVTEAA